MQATYDVIVTYYRFLTLDGQ